MPENANTGDGSSPRMWGTRLLDVVTSANSVHPHACGEHQRAEQRHVSGRGSSPRMWGTPCKRAPCNGTQRFIPTHVGNTSSSVHHDRCTPVHPHACGEHVSTTWPVPGVVGSSPRMWGTLERDLAAYVPERFIPTHVGNTREGAGRRRYAAVHPHACGEHKLMQVCNSAPFGSSPRMWGTQVHAQRQGRGERFIPTHVGNTHGRKLFVEYEAVHPHACGEHSQPCRMNRWPTGSSPRMWGTLVDFGAQREARRFIPTHVGNTPTSRTPRPARTVHPHACGEHTAYRYAAADGDGSSPRMWGTPNSRIPRVGIVRFIPTHVGNTALPTSHCAPHAVHPHACGEHTKHKYLNLKDICGREDSTDTTGSSSAFVRLAFLNC